MSLIKELRRRNVLRIAAAYVVVAWLIIQVAETLFPLFGFNDAPARIVVIVLAIGFVPTLIFAWAFELTPEGLKKEKDIDRSQSIAPHTGKKLDRMIMVVLALALGYFAFDKFVLDPERDVKIAETAAQAGAEQALEKARLGMWNEKSIAVLPFINRSRLQEDEYFTDGMHDELLSRLARFGSMKVISRTSVMRYRDTDMSIPEIAKELAVSTILEGGVQRAGEQVRINVQLINAHTDEHLWAEIYDRELTTSNLFDIQSEIAQSIAAALNAAITNSELTSVGDVPTDSIPAYELYLQARRFMRGGGTKIRYQTALELYKEALTLDPAFKLAWIGLAQAHISNYWIFGGGPTDVERSRQAIDMARELDPDFPELYMAEGVYWYWGHRDYGRALYNLEKAIEQMPGNYEAHMWHGWASRRAGLWEQALDSMHQALKLNPRVHFTWVEFGHTFAVLHRYEEATEALAMARAIDPDNFWAKTVLAELKLVESGDVESAIQLTTGAQHIDLWSFFDVYVTVRVAADRFEEALSAVRNLKDELEIQHSLIRFREDWIARILFYMGRDDEARAAADTAWFRLQDLRTQIGNDYRIDLAEAYLSVIRGESEDEIKTRVKKATASRPEDQWDEIFFRTDSARIFAMAGLEDESIKILESLFSPPSITTVHIIELDPAFDRIRENPGFVAMMERQR